MALTSIIRVECTVCKKIAVEASRLVIGKSTIIKLTCGHLLSSASLVADDKTYDNIIFTDGCKPRPYQIEAIKFAEESNIRCIIADEQGLGKTIEALSLLRLHPEKLLPCVYVAPTTIKIQVMREIRRICGTDPKFLTQVIQSGKEKAMPGFGIYIITYDMLKKDDVFEYVPVIRTLIIDECQKIKNHLSDRAKAVQRIAKNTEHILPMSGTPIYNHAGEYFTVLNLVAPTRFPHYQTYLDNYCDSYDSFYATKVGGLRDVKKFHEATADIIIRRTKDEVLKDLPAKARKFFHVELDPKLNKAYAKALQELDDLLYSDESEFNKSSMMLAIYAKMRHITGVSKVDDCIDFLTEFLLSTDRKITIFTHHIDVADMIQIKINKWLKDGGFSESLRIHSGLDSLQRDKVIEKFKEEPSRVLISIFTEGINLQFCSDAIIHERQWNPPREVNGAEDRFHRFGQVSNVSITYMIASGTIDEYFTEIVEQKRAVIADVMGDEKIEWNEASLMKELALVLTTKGREKWKL